MPLLFAPSLQQFNVGFLQLGVLLVEPVHIHAGLHYENALYLPTVVYMVAHNYITGNNRGLLMQLRSIIDMFCVC